MQPRALIVSKVLAWELVYRMSLQWLWRIIAGALLVVVCLCAFFIPQVNFLLLSLLFLIIVVALANSKFSSTTLYFFGLGTIGLILALCLHSLFPQIQLSRYYLVFKLYRFYTLPSWFWTFQVLIFVFPGVDRWRELASKVHATIFFKQRTPLTLLLVGIVIAQLLTVGSQLFSQGLYTLEHRSLLPTQRYAMRRFGVGESGWFYNVGLFWQKVIPKTDKVTIGIPPQGDPWIKSGNIYYVQYFVFPRKVEMLQRDIKEVPSNVTHIVIARGETDQGDFGWPTMVIPKEQIDWIDVYNPFTNEQWKVENDDYNPEVFKSYYGVIHLKRGEQ